MRNTPKNPTRRFRNLYTWCMFLIAGGFLFACMSTTAFADTPQVGGIVSAGDFSESATGSYHFTGNVGTTATFNMPFTATDLRGTGAGWHITLNTTAFAWTGHPTFPTTATSMTAMGVACAPTHTCGTLPVNNVSLASPLALTAGTDATIFGAPANANSTGVFTLTPTFAVAIPDNAGVGGTLANPPFSVADLYTSTFTLTMVTLPS